MRSSLIYMLMAVGMLLCSCEKFTDVPAPPDSVLSENVYSNDAKATASINGIYSYMMNPSATFSSYQVTITTGSYADELVHFNPSSSQDEFIQSELTATNSTVNRIWTTAYRVIYHANTGIEGLQQTEGVSASLKNQLLGECYFLRAFSHFYLVQLYGDVPLLTTTDWEKNSFSARTNSDAVMKQIVEDLLKAKDLMSASYPSTGRGRANKWTAAALLARVYLYQGEWAKAVTESSAVLNTGLYPLLALNKVFLGTSTEAIWQLVPDPVRLGYVPELFSGGYYTTSIPKYYLRNSMLQVFEKNDLRRNAWVDSITYQSVKYYWPGKYKDMSRKNLEYYVVFRSAEQYLIRAEANVKLKQLDAAVQDLNAIRQRAGLPVYNGAVSEQDVMDAIARERRVELFAEWGHRWFDLKRWGKAGDVIGALKPGKWKGSALLWPIPESELINDVNLVQNPGY